MSNNRLTKPFVHSGEGVETFGNFLALAMANIEDGLQAAGLSADVHYSAADLLREAMPLAREQFFKGVVDMSLAQR